MTKICSMNVKVVGAFGSKMKGMGMSTFVIDRKISIDAGNLISLGKSVFHLNHIILTHHHLDHIADIPFLIAESFPIRHEPLYLWCQDTTIKAIKEHVMNSEVWPDFSHIKMLNGKKPSLQYMEVRPGKEFSIDDYIITPFESNHLVPTLGYNIRKGKKSVVFTGDTWKQDSVWDIVNNDKDVCAVFIDVSYPSRMEKLARESKHLTTRALEDEIKSKLKRDVKILVYHIKPLFLKEVLKEIEQIRKRTGIDISTVRDGQTIKVSP